MNLYDYFNPFMRWLETNYLPDKAIILYLRMLDMFNRRGWAETVGVDLPSIMSMVGTSDRKTATRARDALVTAGFIRYQKGHKGKISVYSLCELGGRKATQNAPQNEDAGLGGNFAPQSAPESAPQSAPQSAPENAPPYKTKTETKTECLSSSYAPAHEEDSSCVHYFRSHVNPTAPERDFVDMAGFVSRFNGHGGDGNAMVIRACDIALSNRKATWAYVAGILNKWEKAGIYTPAMLEAHERERKWKQDGRRNGRHDGDVSEPSPASECQAVDTYQGKRLSKQIPV